VAVKVPVTPDNHGKGIIMGSCHKNQGAMEIARALKERVSLKKIQERLCRLQEASWEYKAFRDEVGLRSTYLGAIPCRLRNWGNSWRPIRTSPKN